MPCKWWLLHFYYITVHERYRQYSIAHFPTSFLPPQSHLSWNSLRRFSCCFLDVRVARTLCIPVVNKEYSFDFYSFYFSSFTGYSWSLFCWVGLYKCLSKTVLSNFLQVYATNDVLMFLRRPVMEIEGWSPDNRIKVRPLAQKSEIFIIIYFLKFFWNISGFLLNFWCRKNRGGQYWHWHTRIWV